MFTSLQRRRNKAEHGMCSTCGCRPVAEGFNQQGLPYKSCDECLIRCRKEGREPDYFCVSCQAHDFHRADCPKRVRKK